MMTKIDLEQFLAVRKAEGQRIDPRTAEVHWHYGQVLDPYGIYHLSAEEECISRMYFARAPGRDLWVSFYDLPEETSDALWEAHRHQLVFPAGLPLDALKRS
jgi:hypothetical protein